MLAIVPVSAQFRNRTPYRSKRPPSKTTQLAEFSSLANRANVTFVFPKGFKEIAAPNDDYFSFDYAMEMPGEDFEIWFQVAPEKENWASYERNQNTPNAQLANPDSVYNEIGSSTAITFTGDKNYFVRNIPPEILARYNADAGKSYLLTLLDLPETKHYKYALMITLEKNHTGTILAVCFTNEKSPEFYKNIDRASNCVKFKNTLPDVNKLTH
jgi:hypothetical protein